MLGPELCIVCHSRRRLRYLARQARKKAQALVGDAHDGAAMKTSMTDQRQGVEDLAAVTNNKSEQVRTHGIVSWLYQTDY